MSAMHRLMTSFDSLPFSDPSNVRQIKAYKWPCACASESSGTIKHRVLRVSGDSLDVSSLLLLTEKKKRRGRKSEIKKENHSQFPYLTDNKYFLLQCLFSIQEQCARAAGVPRKEALQKRRRVSNDRIPLVCYWDEHLPDLGGGGGGGIPVQQYFPVLQSGASLEE